jgi:hypothetical protein
LRAAGHYADRREALCTVPSPQATIVLAGTDNQAAFGAARPSPQDHAAARGNAARRFSRRATFFG